jgi:hypothetical protein
MKNSIEVPKEEPEKKKKTSFKVFLGIVAAVVIFIIGLGIWLLGPMKRVPHTELLPPSAFAFFSIDMDPESSGFSDFIDKVEKKYLNLEPGTFKTRLIMKVIPYIVPDRVTFIATLDDNSTDPGMIFVSSMGKMIKIIRLYSSPFDRIIFRGTSFERDNVKGHGFKNISPSRGKSVTDDLTNPAAYTFVGNNIVAGTSLPVIKSAYYSYRGAQPSDPVARGLVYTHMSEMLNPAKNRADVSILVDNSKGKLSAIVKDFEEKFAFAAFPSIDYVTSISGNLNLLNEEMDSSFTFYCSSPDRLVDVRSDVKFIYGAIRRKLKASGINMKGQVQVEEDTVIFNFKVTDFMEAFL